MTTTGTPRPEFEIVFKGAELEPGADVAPPGEVAFVLMNESQHTHDLAIVQFASDAPRRTEPYRRGDQGLVSLVGTVAPGDARTVELSLEPGRYLLISNTPDDSIGRSFFELTVQPPDGE